MRNDYDVIVAGAGVSGICAALAAKRQGVSVLLVEKSGLTGGAITQAHVNAPAMFNAWGRQIIGGIGWELVTKTLIEEGKPVPDVAAMDANDHVGSALWINPLLFSAICDEALIQAGVDISLHTMPSRIVANVEAGNWLLSLITKEGPLELHSRMLIDCTGDADLARLAGFPCIPYEGTQPGTLSFQISGFDKEALDYEALGNALKDAVEHHELETGDVWWCGQALPAQNASRANMWRMFLERQGMNANHVSLGNPDDSGSRTRFELEGRASVLRLWRFLKRQPGFSNVQFELRSPECGCRESRRVLTEEIVTGEQYRSGFRFPETVAHSFYPIDLHDDICGLKVERLKEGVIPSVPRGALIPQNSKGFLVAGRIIGSDREANSALRIQATCMATGQAAGVLAALTVAQFNAAQGMPDAREVPYSTLRDALLKQKAILL